LMLYLLYVLTLHPRRIVLNITKGELQGLTYVKVKCGLSGPGAQVFMEPSINDP